MALRTLKNLVIFSFMILITAIFYTIDRNWGNNILYTITLITSIITLGMFLNDKKAFLKTLEFIGWVSFIVLMLIGLDQDPASAKELVLFMVVICLLSEKVIFLKEKKNVAKEEKSI